MRLGMIAACLTVVGVARADQAAPSEPISAVRGVVARVVPATVGSAQFALIEWRDLEPDDPPAQLPSWTELVPFAPTACTHVFAIVDNTRAWISKDKSRHLLVPGPRPSYTGAQPIPIPWCHVSAGVDGATSLPSLAELARTEGDAVLPGLTTLIEFFGAESPIDAEIESALAELQSDASLELALAHGFTYFAANQHPFWRVDSSHYDVVVDALWNQPWPDGHADLALVKLSWQLLPGGTAKRIREEYAKDPRRALDVLDQSPPWDEAIDLAIELSKAEQAAGRDGYTTLYVRGNERAADFLRGERARVTTPELRDAIDATLARFDARTQRGVIDAVTLAAYVRANPSDDAIFEGMRLSAIGPKGTGCEVRHPVGRFELRVLGDCDAETGRYMESTRGNPPITLTGSVQRVHDGGDYVEINLEAAQVADGFVAAPPPDAGAPAIVRDAGAVAAKPPAKASGGCCHAGADGASPLVLVLLLLWWRRVAWS